eukprot:GHVT01002890.1.p1 GENE.GHVT01002890.1~~GHVT01002890.1.p1  ORF type:complete len:107 (+),score=3.57 GHVT01002890.1:42-323(+)
MPVPARACDRYVGIFNCVRDASLPVGFVHAHHGLPGKNREDQVLPQGRNPDAPVLLRASALHAATGVTARCEPDAHGSKKVNFALIAPVYSPH